MDLDIVHVTRCMSLILIALRCNYTYVIFLPHVFMLYRFFNGASLLSLVFQMRLLEVFIKCSMLFYSELF